MPKIAFRPVWLTAPIDQLSSDDIGAYIVWLQQSLGNMAEVDRYRAKKIRKCLAAEQRSRCDMFHVEGWRFAYDIAWCLLSAFCAIFNAVTVNDDDPPRKFAP